jgi:hypothetical protein
VKSFTDNKARAWNVAIDAPAIKRVRKELEVDLLDAGLLKRLSDDPVLLVDLLWVLVSPQAGTIGVTDEDFGRSLAGDAIDHATRAFLDALLEFLPGQKRRLMEAAVEKLRKLEETVATRGAEILGGRLLDDKVEAALQMIIDRITVKD